MYDYTFLVLKSSIFFSFEIKLFIICARCIHRIAKKGGCHTNLNFSFLSIYVIVPLYRRKFCDSYIILVLNWFCHQKFKIIKYLDLTSQAKSTYFIIFNFRWQYQFLKKSTWQPCFKLLTRKIYDGEIKRIYQCQ